MSERVWIIDIDALDDVDAATTLRYASGDYTQVDAGPVHHFYEPRLVQPSVYQVRANTGDLLPGRGRSSVGEAVLLNVDGGLDYLADYAVDGRAMTLRYAIAGVVTTVFTATVERMVFSAERVNISLRDPLAPLDQPIAANRYTGSNVLPDGVEGTAADIGGNRKPLVFGSVVNATPVLVNTAKLIYQVHDGSDVTVTAVRDRGVDLTFESTATDLTDLLTTAPAAGYWRTFEGYISLGSAAQSITCDAVRDNAGAGDVFNELAVLGGFSVNAADITALNAIGDVGLYVVDEQSYATAMGFIANGCGAVWAINSTGVIRVLALAAPSSPDLVIENYQIITLDRSAIGSGTNGLPINKVTVRADKVETVQSDLAATTVNPARYAQEYRDSVAEDTAVVTRHPLSESISIDSALRSVSDAANVASTLLALLKPRRDDVECGAEIDSPDALAVGMTVQLNTTKLAYPRSFLLLGWRVDAKRSRVYFNLWG